MGRRAHTYQEQLQGLLKKVSLAGLNEPRDWT